MTNSKLIDALNEALSWELRAQTLYAHYAAYISGIYRLHLAPHFAAESAESVDHAGMVRSSIVKLGGVAVTSPHTNPVIHTTDYREQLVEAYKTEEIAAQHYERILKMISDDDEMYDLIQQIYFAEVRSLEEIRQLQE